MKGDFSNWRYTGENDHQAVLFQQGRVFHAEDMSDAEALALGWRITAGRDIIGANVAAVPATDPEGYKVENVALSGGEVTLDLHEGRLWADGLHTILSPGEPGGSIAQRLAEYLPAPHNPAGTDTSSITAGTRDAVVLEISLEELNGFQAPERLLEPALGGPDTAERVIPHAALRLARLAPRETCRSIGPRLRDDLQSHGRLSVSLEPVTVTAGDCPVVEGGGYSGFEHNLYRIEIAETNGDAPRFKWSQFNGGLVGRGMFVGGGAPHVQITANRTAILTSGLSSFYLEALEYDEDRGHWRVVYGAPATLNSDDELDLSTPATFGTLPGPGRSVFFRLWNGIEEIAAYDDDAEPAELPNGYGIRLAFDDTPDAVFRPGSYWTFDVRAGGLANDEILVDDAPPEGPIIRRVPLAEITWDGAGGASEIHDCRRRFRPLADQKLCCTYVVGNGVTSFGDFNSLEEAARHLPPLGGKLCLLPGLHMANLSLEGRVGIAIEGCRHRTVVLPRMKTPAQPIIAIAGGRDILIRDVDFIAPFGIAIDARGFRAAPLRELQIEGCRMMALTHGIHVDGAADLRILGNQIWVLDHPRAINTISVRAIDALIERNRTGVWPFEFGGPPPSDGGDDEPADPADPCIEPEELYEDPEAVVEYAQNVWASDHNEANTGQPYKARGGMHLKGGCAGVDIRRNRIIGGIGHGITLGGVFPDEDGGGVTPVGVAGAAGAASATEASAAPEVRVVTAQFYGTLQDDAGLPLSGVAVQLIDEDGLSRGAASSDENGAVKIPADSGRYTLEVAANWRVDAMSSFNTGSETAYVITLAPVETPQAAVNLDAAFLTRIRIIENTIVGAGLSGIGFWFHSAVPQVSFAPAEAEPDALAAFLSALIAPKELLGTVNICRDLEIRDNRIERNLRATFTKLLQATAQIVAQGGISLGVVEGLRVTGNHIEGNGVTGANPCAGVFVGYGEDVEIAGNKIIGNGPVDHATYRQGRIGGLRGGIVIRLAASVVVGATSDGFHKPALLIRDNVIDQPAGRAITALAYGPVSMIGNTLNSEYEGTGNFLEAMFGGVLLVNLGGMHRFLGLGQGALGADFNSVAGANPQGTLSANSASTSLRRLFEALLPGGETLVNSNRLRTGPANLSWSGQAILTADDLGFDGNQSGTFRTDMTFCNTIAFAHSLRMSDNRFREAAEACAMSALTLSAGKSVLTGNSAMNITTHNQGDHCIIAMTSGAQPVIDGGNQVVFDQFCPVGDDKGEYVLLAFLFMLAMTVGPNFSQQAAASTAEQAAPQAVEQIQQFQVQSAMEYTLEAERASLDPERGGAERVALQAAAGQRLKRADAIGAQKDVFTLREEAIPERGVLFDGMVYAPSGRLAKGQSISFVTKDGRALDIEATTDARGYYALALDEAELARIKRAGDVYLEVRDSGGALLNSGEVKVALKDDTLVRTDIALKTLPKATEVVRGPLTPVMRDGRVVEPTPEPTPGPTPTPGPAPTPDPTPDPGLRAEVPLGEVEGLGRARIAGLRRLGITDARALLTADRARVREVLGGATESILASAKRLVARIDRS